MSVTRPFLQTLAIALAFASSAGTAVAQGAREGGATASQEVASKPEANASVEQARQAFILGATLAAQQQWADALNAFERSSRLHSHPVTTYNLAYCERALGHYTRSYRLFRRALAEHETGSTGKLPEDLFALAKAYVPELERKVAHVHVRMAPELANMSVDGRPLEAASSPGISPLVLTAGTRDTMGSEAPPASSFDLMIDPGRHVFVVSRTGEPDRVLVEVFEEGDTRELAVDTSPRQKPPSSKAPSPPPKRAEASRVPVYVAYGVGGAGLIVGSVFGIAAIREKSYLDDHCSKPSACDRSYQGDIDALSRDALLSDIGFGVALLGAGFGTYFLLTTGSGSEHSPKPEGSALPKIEPWISPRGFGARGTF